MDYIPDLLKRITLGERKIFRGHADASWDLTSSIGRHHTGEWETVGKRERLALEEFRTRSVPYIRHRPSSDLEWLCLMQHHGCSTRLLDFTTNPLIALFFAAQESQVANGRLVVATYTKTHPEALEADLFEHKNAFAYHPPHITERIIGQSGCFVFCGVPNHPLDERNCESITIEAMNKQAIREELRALGISSSTLFPGIDGICQDLNQTLLSGLSL